MKDFFNMEGRVAVITGASSGIGNSYCHVFAKYGAKIAAFARRAERLEQLQKDIEAAGGVCLPVVCDVSEEDQVVAGVKKVIDHFGKIDILINVAGAISVCPTTELTLEKWQHDVDVSLTGYFLMARECGKNMIANRYGRIINTSSMFGKICSFHNPILSYNATKGAIPNFTRSLAQEWAQYNITVNAIGPGMFPSEMMLDTPEVRAYLEARCPIGRFGNMEELHGQALLFASEHNSYTTGQTIYIDGGWTSV